MQTAIVYLCVLLLIAIIFFAGFTRGQAYEQQKRNSPMLPGDTEGFDGFVGQKITQNEDDPVLKQIRQLHGDETIRVLYPTSLATADYRIERLNILLDTDGTIEEFRYG